MLKPFFELLKKKHIVPRYTSYDDTKSEVARELQLLQAANNKDEYEAAVEKYKEQGIKVRLTKGRVYEIHEEGDTVEVSIALQVKGNSLTWYFWAPNAMDEYPQEFRDKLYDTAGECHTQVERGCDLYYRGSNAIHIKLMHHVETESNHNHNHYRLKGRLQYQPHDFNQHLHAFEDPKFKHIHDLFFEPGEINKICSKFAVFHHVWTRKQTGSPSLKEQYESDQSQLFNQEDILEIGLFGKMQEPCRVSSDELKMDYENARLIIAMHIKGDVEQEMLVNLPQKARLFYDTLIDKVPEGMKGTRILSELAKRVEKEYSNFLDTRKLWRSRGLNSEIASTRQIEGSENAVISQVVGMSDSRGKSLFIPIWSPSCETSTVLAFKEIGQMALTRMNVRDMEEQVRGSPYLDSPLSLTSKTKFSEHRRIISADIPKYTLHESTSKVRELEHNSAQRKGKITEHKTFSRAHSEHSPHSPQDQCLDIKRQLFEDKARSDSDETDSEDLSPNQRT